MYIRVENVNQTYIGRDKKHRDILANVNLEIKKKEFVCIVGQSGCGKTVLLNILAGFTNPTSGKVYIGDEIVLEPSPNYVTIFQDYKLLPWRTVRKNIELGFEGKGNQKSKKEIEEIVNFQIKSVGLENFANYRPSEISGGMKQRVAIARALAVDPKIIFMDEPFGALDSFTKQNLQDKLVDLLRNTDTTVIFVTHSVEEAVFLADRIVVMEPAPKSISTIINVDLPHPRDRGSKEFFELRELVFSELKKTLTND